jgi:hypothetical protein
MKLKNYYKRNWRSLEFVPAWNCIQWQKTNDCRYLIKGLDYEELPEIFDVQKQRLTLIGFDINCQCTQFEIDNSRRNKLIFDLMKKIEIRTAEYHNVKNIVVYLQLAGRDPYFEDILKAAGHHINDGDFKAQLKRISNSNENLLPKINQDKYELDALTNEGGKTTINENEALIQIEKFNKKDIDLKKITMKKYLTLKLDYNNYIDRAKTKTSKTER